MKTLVHRLCRCLWWRCNRIGFLDANLKDKKRKMSGDFQSKLKSRLKRSSFWHRRSLIWWYNRCIVRDGFFSFYSALNSNFHQIFSLWRFFYFRSIKYWYWFLASKAQALFCLVFFLFAYFDSLLRFKIKNKYQTMRLCIIVSCVCQYIG